MNDQYPSVRKSGQRLPFVVPLMALATLRLPRRATLVLALVVFAGGHVIAALSSGFVTALAAGAFWAVASVVATAAAGPERSSRALGVMMSGVGLATVAGVPLGSFAGQLLGWRGTFWGLAALALLAAPVIAWFTPHDIERAVPSIRSELRAVATGRTAVLVVATVLATGGYMTVFSYLSPLATNRAGIGDWAVPLLFVVFGIGAVIGTNLAGRFADKRPLTTFIAATGGTIIAMGLLAPLSTNALAIFALLLLLLGLAGMGIPPVGTGLAVRFAMAAPTLAAALAVSAFNGGTALGTWIGGIALESSLGSVGPLTVRLAMAALGLIVLLIMATKRLTSDPDRRRWCSKKVHHGGEASPQWSVSVCSQILKRSGVLGALTTVVLQALLRHAGQPPKIAGSPFWTGAPSTSTRTGTTSPRS